MTFEKQVQDWAIEAFNFYSIVARERNMDFYTQSPLDVLALPPDVVVMGINPGSDGVFNTEFDVNRFIKGNGCWKNHRQWAYIKRTENILNMALRDEAEDIFNDDTRIVYINASCLATKKANTLAYDLFLRSIPLTVELIKLLRPKLLLCLSAKKNV